MGDRLGASDCEAFVDGWLGQPVNTVSSLAFVVAALVVVRSDRSPTRLAVAAALLVVGVGSVAFHGPQPGWAGPVHDVGVLAVPLALVVHVAAGRDRLDLSRLAVGALAFAIGLSVFVASRTGGPWCDPHSMLQGHAAWHVIAAMATALGTSAVASQDGPAASP